MKTAVALVTGAGSGIGKAAALALAKEGFKVGALGHTQEEISSTVNAILAAGGDAVAVLADISDEHQMEAAVRQLTEQFSRLDVVVANAGINGVWAPIDDLKLSEWNDTIAVNLTGTFLTIRATVPNVRVAAPSSLFPRLTERERSQPRVRPPIRPPRPGRWRWCSSWPLNLPATTSASTQSVPARSKQTSTLIQACAMKRKRRYRSCGLKARYRSPEAGQVAVKMLRM